MMENLNKEIYNKIVRVFLVILILCSLVVGVILNCMYTIDVTSWNIGLSIFVLVNVIALLLLKYIQRIIDCFNNVYKSLSFKIIDFLSSIFTLYGQRLRARLNNKIDYNFDILSPRILEDSEYVNILKSQIDNNLVRNIAISGPYSSGKSSVLRTFQEIYPQYKCLNLSMAIFSEEQDKDRSSKPERENGEGVIGGMQRNVDSLSMQGLEYSLLQQFFYHVKASKIPDSRFGRIHRWKWINKICITSAVFLFVLCNVYLFKLDWLISEFSGLVFLRNDIFKILCYIIYLVEIFYAIYYLVFYIHKISSGRVKLMDYEIEFKKDLKTSVFNRYLDELIYLFQTTGYQIVILEDLDRFNNTSIFTKLRELNILLNQSQDINRRIIFIYALKDEIFKESHERTKFFDFILPIIPHTNAFNSASKFVEVFNTDIKEESSENEISKEFLYDVAPFVSDLRIIKAIVNDFEISSLHLDKSISKQKLLAILIYKNLCPNEFEKIYNGEGLIVETFREKVYFIEEKKELKSLEIEKIKKELLSLSNEYLQSIRELQSLVIAELLIKIPVNSELYNSSKKKVSYSDLYDEEYIIEILEGKFQYRDKFSYNYYTISSSQILSSLGPDFDYFSRKKTIELKNENKKHSLEKRLEVLQKEINDIERISMKKLCEGNEDIVCGDKETLEVKLLDFLVRRGYIDENYVSYISIFTEGILTVNDNDYLLSIKFRKTIEGNSFSLHLDNPVILLKHINPQDYMSDRILNVYLVHEIMKSKNESYIKNLMDKICMGGNTILDFISCYILQYSFKDTFLKYVLKSYKNLWTDIEDYHGISEDKMIFLFEKILEAGDIEDLVSLNYDGRFSEYLSSAPYNAYLDLGLSQDKFKTLIKTLDIKIKHIKGSSDDGITRFLYNGNFYQQNKHNLFLILEKYSDLDLTLYSNAIYSAIIDANIEPLRSQVERNIEDFVKKCVLLPDNINELSNSIIILLNNENISSELKETIIGHNKTIIESVEEIKNIDLKNKFYEQNKVQPTLNNISYYLVYNEFDDIDSTLMGYIKYYSKEIINCIHNSEEDELAIQVMLENESVDGNIWQEILKNNFYDKVINDYNINLRKEQLPFYINTKEKADTLLESTISDFDLLKKSLMLSEDNKLKMKAVSCYLEEHDELENSSMYDLISVMGEPLNKIADCKGETFEIERADISENFIEELLKRDMVNRKRGTKNKIKVVTK